MTEESTADRFAWVPVKIDGQTLDGQKLVREFNAKFRVLDPRERAAASANGDLAFIHHVLVDWEGLVGLYFEPIPFSPLALKELCEAEQFRLDVITTYFTAFQETGVAQ